jgi:metal-responsive CopG/Arc/MetJ family transcriptional regulator
LLAAVDDRARTMGVSRSRFVRLALQEFVGPPRPVTLDEAIAIHFQAIDPVAATAIDAALEEP